MSEEEALEYWRRNKEKYPSQSLWVEMSKDNFKMSFKTRKELMAWANNWQVAKNDPVWQSELKRREYSEKQRLEAAYSEARLHDLNSWESYFAKVAMKKKLIQEDERRAQELAATNVQLDTMKELVRNLPEAPARDNDDEEVLYDSDSD